MTTKPRHTGPGLSRIAVLSLVAALFLILAVPFVLNPSARFGGTDDAGKAAVAEVVPGYQPWARPIWQPPSSEIESTLFALQAAIGGGVIGYVLGVRRGRVMGKGHKGLQGHKGRGEGARE